MRIGVLGGSFDPVHNAHLIVARLASEQLALDRVHFTVAATQPFKRDRHIADAGHRLRMVELAVDGISDFVADGRELARTGPSYTVDTLRALAAEYPEAELVLIMGADVAASFGSWREPEEVRRLAQIAVCHRGGFAAAGLVQDGSATAARFDARIDVPLLDISSTMIRARARAGRSVTGWVPSRVADYIVASQLYVE